MKKPNIIIGKKQIILACLTLILGLAIYLNYAFAGSERDITASLTKDDASSKEDIVNYGDAEFVSAESDASDSLTDASDNYFSQARLAKMTSRDEAVETLTSILNGGDLTKDEMSAVQAEAFQMSKLVESEDKIENLIRAQGFSECVVYLDGDSANIVVKTEGLVPSEAAQIKDILLSEISVKSENIRIFEVK